MRHTKDQTQSPRLWPMLAWALFLVLAPTATWAGGVVEELHTASFAISAKKNTSGSHHTTNDVKEAPPSATPTACTKPAARPELVSLFYDPIQKHTVIRWKAFVHLGRHAVQYHIYRWSLKNPTRRLIAKVDGDIFVFVDEIKTTIGEVYFYDIIGIYHIGGKYQTWQYPSKQMLPKELPPQETTAPQAGIGCSTLQHQTPKDGWLWLLTLPLFFLFRQRRHDTIQ